MTTIDNILEEFDKLFFWEVIGSEGKAAAIIKIHPEEFKSLLKSKLETLEQEVRERTLKEVEEMMKYKPCDYYTHTNRKSYHSEIEILKALTELRKGGEK